MRKLNFVKLSILLGVGLLLANSTLAITQDATTEAPKEKSAEQKEKDLAMTIELYSTIMAKTFEKADVEDDQMEKIKGIIDECIPKLVKTRSKLEGMLTPSQKKMYAAAQRQAIKAKYAQKDAEAYAMRKLKLPAETALAYTDAKAKVEAINQEMNDKIEALLTDEQRARLPMFSKKQPNIQVRPVPHIVKFPAMKTDADAKKIEDLVKSIKDANTSEVSIPTQSIRIELPGSTNLRAEMEKLSADNQILEGWHRVKPGRNTVVKPGGSGAKAGSDSKPGSDSKAGK